MELELFVLLTPTATHERLGPAPSQILGKLLPKSSNQIFCEPSKR